MSQLKIKDGNSWINIPAGGIGVPSGGDAGDVLVKSSATDYATEWKAPQPIYPDYTNQLFANSSGAYSYTAVAPCFFYAITMSTSSSYSIKVNNVTVSIKNNTGSTTLDLAVGYMKIGDVITGTGGLAIWGL